MEDSNTARHHLNWNYNTADHQILILPNQRQILQSALNPHSIIKVSKVEMQH
jgi:hypothetical protein